MNGSEAKQKVGQLSDQPPPPSRSFVGYQALRTTSGPTQLHRQTISTGKKELTNLKKALTAFKENVMPNLEQVVRNAGAPPIEDN